MKRIKLKQILICCSLSITLFSQTSYSNTRSPETIKTQEFVVDFSESKGKIKALNGVNCGPLAERGTIDLSLYFKELGIPNVRLHDCFWPFPDVIDICEVFPNFSANADDPANYDFEKTDDYVNAIFALGAEPIYRLGYSAERDVLGNKYRRHNIPPQDLQKWISVCLNIIKHYNDGWANGYQKRIKYWEIWNEPNGKPFWTGTAEEFFKLYVAVAKAVKKYDPTLQVGGASFVNTGTGKEWSEFLKYCKDKNAPLDFYSWHTYTTKPNAIIENADTVRKYLDENGFHETKSCLFEWNYYPGSWELFHKDPFYTKDVFDRIGSIEGASFVASVLLLMQDSSIDMGAFSYGDTLRWGLFDRSGVPRKNFYAFKAFKYLLDTPNRKMSRGDDLEKGLAICAGVSGDNTTATIMISNFNSEYHRYKISLENLPWNGSFIYQIYVLDSKKNLELVRSSENLMNSTSLTLYEDIDEVPSVYLIRMTKID